MESLNDENIRDAVILWCNNKEKAILKYGNISNWNVSEVTNMDNLFLNMVNFNDCINNWNVSNVTCMFNNTTSFNQNINNWDVSNVKNIKYMFNNTTSFNNATSFNKIYIVFLTNYRYIIIKN